MNESKNIHAGHRQRMLDKLLKDSSNLPDHELLEILLFYSIPRKNTNGIAHDLINTFGSLDRVFDASPNALLTVSGIGKNAVSSIILFSQMYKRLKALESSPKTKLGISFAHDREIIRNYFKDDETEKAVVFLLDDKRFLIKELTFEDKHKDKVFFDMQEVLSYFAVIKPSSVILAHNHPSGKIQPSVNDDLSTSKMLILCSVHGVSMLDHIILSNTDEYSYFADGRLQYLNENCKLDKIIGRYKDYE